MHTKADLKFINDHPFATLISSKKNQVAHLSKAPLLLKESGDQLILEGHLAKVNPHIQFLQENPNLTVVFDGPHGYISPTWYKEIKTNVPTWNYTTLSLTGSAKIITSNDWLLDSVMELSAYFEESSAWEKAVDKNYLKNLSRGITGVQISVDSIKSKFKLSQDRAPQDKQGVIKNLMNHNPNLAKKMRDA